MSNKEKDPPETSDNSKEFRYLDTAYKCQGD